MRRFGSRLDCLLVETGLVASRTNARRLIDSGHVTVDGVLAVKASQRVSESSELKILERSRFVSRGGEKLDGALDAFQVSVSGLDCLDVGASTGGFTDCLLQRGAASVVCVDVGHGQLHPQLLGDPRVTSLEGVHAARLEQVELPMTHFPVVVADLSFISLTKVLGAVWPRVAGGGVLISLVKPQFELGAEVMRRCRGVIRDYSIARQSLKIVEDFVSERFQGALRQAPHFIDSPIAGGDGNREFFVLLGRL